MLQEKKNSGSNKNFPLRRVLKREQRWGYSKLTKELENFSSPTSTPFCFVGRTRGASTIYSSSRVASATASSLLPVAREGLEEEAVKHDNMAAPSFGGLRKPATAGLRLRSTPSIQNLEAAAKVAAEADGLLRTAGGGASGGGGSSGGTGSGGSSRKRKASGLRRGKWTSEEESYANRLIQEFKGGLLPLQDGTTLRTFLSIMLNCDPMRISKKFVGAKCIGKQVFRRRQSEIDKLTAIETERSRTELAELERRFLERVHHLSSSQRGKAQAPGNSVGGGGDAGGDSGSSGAKWAGNAEGNRATSDGESDEDDGDGNGSTDGGGGNGPASDPIAAASAAAAPARSPVVSPVPGLGMGIGGLPLPGGFGMDPTAVGDVSGVNVGLPVDASGGRGLAAPLPLFMGVGGGPWGLNAAAAAASHAAQAAQAAQWQMALGGGGIGVGVGMDPSASLPGGMLPLPGAMVGMPHHGMPVPPQPPWGHLAAPPPPLPGGMQPRPINSLNNSLVAGRHVSGVGGLAGLHSFPSLGSFLSVDGMPRVPSLPSLSGQGLGGLSGSPSMQDLVMLLGGQGGGGGGSGSGSGSSSGGASSGNLAGLNLNQNGGGGMEGMLGRGGGPMSPDEMRQSFAENLNTLTANYDSVSAPVAAGPRPLAPAAAGATRGTLGAGGGAGAAGGQDGYPLLPSILGGISQGDIGASRTRSPASSGSRSPIMAGAAAALASNGGRGDGGGSGGGSSSGGGSGGGSSQDELMQRRVASLRNLSMLAGGGGGAAAAAAAGSNSQSAEDLLSLLTEGIVGNGNGDEHRMPISMPACLPPSMSVSDMAAFGLYGTFFPPVGSNHLNGGDTQPGQALAALAAGIAAHTNGSGLSASASHPATGGIGGGDGGDGGCSNRVSVKREPQPAASEMGATSSMAPDASPAPSPTALNGGTPPIPPAGAAAAEAASA